jgi:hypothetical protein
MEKPVFKQPGASKNYAAPPCWNATDARTNFSPLPLAGRAIPYGIFNESSLRTQGPIRRGLSFLHWSRGLFSLLRPGVMMVWTAPYGIAMCQNEVVEISDKGAVREPDYPHWNGYVEAYFSAARG